MTSGVDHEAVESEADVASLETPLDDAPVAVVSETVFELDSVVVAVAEEAVVVSLGKAILVLSRSQM